jgi:hypothetical protein
MSAASILDEFAPARVAHMRANNDARFRGWDAKRVIRLHRKTLESTAAPGEYVDGIRRLLADGTYRRLYPPHVVEATRRFVADLSARESRAGGD